MPFELDFVFTRAFVGTAGCPQTAEEIKKRKRKNGFTVELIPPKTHRNRWNRFMGNKFAYLTFNSMTTIYFHKIHANGGIARIDDFSFLFFSFNHRNAVNTFQFLPLQRRANTQQRYGYNFLTHSIESIGHQ